MGLENTHQIDAAGIEPDTGLCVLTIIDAAHWPDEQTQLKKLQAKFNAYFGFVQTRQLQDAYPDSQGRGVAIDLLTAQPLSPPATKYLTKAAESARQLNITLRHRLISPT